MACDDAGCPECSDSGRDQFLLNKLREDRGRVRAYLEDVNQILKTLVLLVYEDPEVTESLANQARSRVGSALDRLVGVDFGSEELVRLLCATSE